MERLLDVLRNLLGLRPTEESSASTQEPAKPVAVATSPRPVSAPHETARPTATAPVTVPAVAAKDAPAPTGLESDFHTKKLPPLDTVLSAGGELPGLNYGQRSDIGQARDNNQDAMLAFTASMSSADSQPNFGLFMVADGMGGHEDGEKASAAATRVIAKYVTSDIFIPLLNGETGGDSERPTIIEVLRNAVQKANEVVSERVPDGGTTVTAAAIMGHSAYIAHVGDTRAYLISADLIEQVTRDHSLVQRLIELDQLTPEDAIEHPQRNVLYRALGQSDNVDVDAIIRQIPAGSYLMLCSDGLWNLVTKEEIQKIVLENQNNTQNACEHLVALANERGGSDNITVVLVRVPG
jgi:serine/threonine protein phosphatase PrpC